MLYFGDKIEVQGTEKADPRAVKRWLAEAYEVECARHSEVAKDINHIGGERGYGREKKRGSIQK